MMPLPVMTAEPNCSVMMVRSVVSDPSKMGMRLLESMVMPAVAAAGVMSASSRMVE